jgi:hypothetical protein
MTPFHVSRLEKAYDESQWRQLQKLVLGFEA